MQNCVRRWSEPQEEYAQLPNRRSPTKVYRSTPSPITTERSAPCWRTGALLVGLSDSCRSAAANLPERKDIVFRGYVSGWLQSGSGGGSARDLAVGRGLVHRAEAEKGLEGGEAALACRK
jgi:hypothetical protein